MNRREGESEQDRHRRMWSEIRRVLGLKNNEDYPDWTTCAAVARKLGFTDYAEAWERSKAK